MFDLKINPFRYFAQLKNIGLALVCVFVYNTVSYAQPTHFTKSDYWKHQRKEFLFGIGGTKKINSSSWILKEWEEK